MQPWTDHHSPQSGVTSGTYLNADEIGILVGLMQELRDLTLSRRSFAAASEIIARFTGEADISHVVPVDVLDG